MKKLLTDIELDFYELKCLLEFLDKNPNDNRLYKVAQRSLSHLTTRMSELKEGFDNTYVESEAEITPASIDQKTTVDVFAPLQTDEPSVKVEEVEEVDSAVYKEADAEEQEELIENIEEKESSYVTDTRLESGAMFRALSLNDVFRFSRELFNGDSKKLKDAVAEMEKLGSYEQSIGYLSSIVNCSIDDFAFQDIDDFLKRFYKQ